MAVPGVRAATYDGDTPPDERRWIRDHANVVLTNPDLLHHSLLPGHERWSRFLRSLEYVVVDECHVYRGVFGSHVSAVLRRLRRVAARYGATPTFVLASATVSEPAVHAARLIGMPVTAVTDDGSPRGAMTFALWEPAHGRRAPPVGDDRGRRDPRRAGARRGAGGGVRAQPSRGGVTGHQRAPARRARRPGAGRGGRGLPRAATCRRTGARSSAACATGRCAGWPRRTRSSSASTSAASTRWSWPAGRAVAPACGSRPGGPGARARSRWRCSWPPTTRSTPTSCATRRRSSASRSRPPSWTRTTRTCWPRTSRPPRRSCRWARATCRCSGPTRAGCSTRW